MTKVTRETNHETDRESSRCKMIAAASRIAARNGTTANQVIAAYRRAVRIADNGGAINAKMLYLA